jgi:glycosyltransferase involved in cell wall biosynthesis
MNKIRIGIDASSTREGGGIRHLTEILNNVNIDVHNIEVISVWGNTKTLSKLPEFPWLKKNHLPILEKSIFHRVYWWLFIFDRILKKECDVLLSTGGTFVGRFKPFVAMSRNMLVFDQKERSRYGMSFNRIRLKALNFAQSKTFISATGVIFISKYAQKIITEQLNLKGKPSKVIHHGISDIFLEKPKPQKVFSKGELIKVLYISTIDEYKHQWNVVEAVYNLRQKGYNILLDLIGGNGFHRSMIKFNNAVNKFDSNKEFIHYHGLVNHDEVHDYYKRANIFVYSSTCENMPNILIEAMSAGLPIASSNYNPMPEFIQDAAEYFEPTSVASTEQVLELLINNPFRRLEIAEKAYRLAAEYSWEKCSNDTFEFLNEIVNKSKLK